MISFFFSRSNTYRLGGTYPVIFAQEDRIAEENTLKSAETQRGKAPGGTLR
jgi:hypothetical protein